MSNHAAWCTHHTAPFTKVSASDPGSVLTSRARSCLAAGEAELAERLSGASQAIMATVITRDWCDERLAEWGAATGLPASLVEHDNRLHARAAAACAVAAAKAETESVRREWKMRYYAHLEQEQRLEELRLARERADAKKVTIKNLCSCAPPCRPRAPHGLPHASTACLMPPAAARRLGLFCARQCLVSVRFGFVLVDLSGAAASLPL